MTYRYFELGKNADPEREDSPEFKNAFTVHPVSDPNLMYRLHKRFSHIELEWTYLQIQQLQVCNTGFVFCSYKHFFLPDSSLLSQNLVYSLFLFHHTLFRTWVSNSWLKQYLYARNPREGMWCCAEYDLPEKPYVTKVAANDSLLELFWLKVKYSLLHHRAIK